MQDDEGVGPADVYDTAEYIADMASQLAIMAFNAGLVQTAAALMRAQVQSQTDMHRLQFEKAAPDDAA